MATRTRNPRVYAVRALQQVVDRNLPLDNALNELGDVTDRSWIQELVYGVLRQFFRLDALAGKLLKKPLKDKNRDIHLLILVGLYELFHMDTSAHAAVNETVAVTRLLNKEWSSGLVNACLRRAQRERETLEQQIMSVDEARYNQPAWFIEVLQRHYPASWEQIVDASNQRPPMHLRVNVRHLARDEYLDHLREAGIDARPLTTSPDGIALVRPVPVNLLPGFEHGDVSVQDGAAQLAAYLLDLAPGQHVLDACAAPGGKACHILEHEARLDGLELVENSEVRSQRIEQNFTRLGLEAILHIADASAPQAWWDGRQFQRILLDAPCSATGVIRRHPDIKLHRSTEQVTMAAALQDKILEALWPLLEGGGKLLYVTCSVLPEENEHRMARFLAAHADAMEIELELSWAQRRQHGYQILPGTADLDGFYYACIRKQ